MSNIYVYIDDQIKANFFNCDLNNSFFLIKTLFYRPELIFISGDASLSNKITEKRFLYWNFKLCSLTVNILYNILMDLENPRDFYFQTF